MKNVKSYHGLTMNPEALEATLGEADWATTGEDMGMKGKSR
jgi:hypothetical protein